MHIALYHNLPSGGAKRTLHAQVKRLATQHQIDAFTLSCADSNFSDIRSCVHRHQVFAFVPLPLFRSPLGRINQLIRIADLVRLRRVGRIMASQIDSQAYEAAYVHPCQYTNSPSVLHYLRTPSVFYSQETLRAVYDPPSRSGNHKRHAVQSLFDRVDPLPTAYRIVLAREDQRNLKSASLVLVNSRFSCESFMRSYGISPRVCYHGVDTDVFRPLGLPKDRMVLSVGALRPNKGFDFVIESLAQIPQALRPPLTIVSNYQDPFERVYLEDLSQCQGVDLRLLQLVDDKTLIELYNRAMLTVYAPILEPFGLVPLESMACGTPVVAVAEGGVRETVVDGVTGILVDRDTPQFARAVCDLLYDQGRVARYGRQARDYVLERWTWDAAVQRLEDRLREIASGGRQVSDGWF